MAAPRQRKPPKIVVKRPRCSFEVMALLMVSREGNISPAPAPKRSTTGHRKTLWAVKGINKNDIDIIIVPAIIMIRGPNLLFSHPESRVVRIRDAMGRDNKKPLAIFPAFSRASKKSLIQKSVPISKNMLIKAMVRDKILEVFLNSLRVSVLFFQLNG